jgi:hypothetical protein
MRGQSVPGVPTIRRMPVFAVGSFHVGRRHMFDAGNVDALFQNRAQAPF